MTVHRRRSFDLTAPRTTATRGEFSIESPPWMDEALCAQTDPELFFPERGGSPEAKHAKAICAACPVRAECLEYALAFEFNTRAATPFRYGIWGGLSERERRAVLRERGVA